MDWDTLLKEERLIDCLIQYTDMGLTLRACIQSANYDLSAHYDGCEIQLRLVRCRKLYIKRWLSAPDQTLSFSLPDRPPDTNGRQALVFDFKKYGRAVIYPWGHNFPDDKRAQLSRARRLKPAHNNVPVEPTSAPK